MSSLTITEKSKIEKLLRMSGGYVLEFSNNSLQNFVADSIKLDILDEKYNQGSGSKANRLRALWSNESDELVGKLLNDLLDKIPEDWERRRDITGEEISEDIRQAYEDSKQACERLIGKTSVEHLDGLQAIDYDENFQLLSHQIKASIDSGEPAAGLDRLHTFLIKYFRHLCTKHGLTTTREEPLNAVFGKYVKALVASGILKSEMSHNILKYSINILSSFNAVRNDQSLAHDNTVLNRDESLLIFRNISALVKFIEHIEAEN
ncbi:hypothetical protein FNT36_24860 [Hymenobacter setariae]|uniref:Abortive infection protein-like C-terminal domain-containing protein n=1 Tax=Hymenobacter setariae TaxID=2594794 RepID=A0A558BJQ7_9BACT|nr:abortive infection family protein [Hymenobacter setariae]TVT36747.1 hypothetical protein FNT36_24860 [Hymenobacter setariae]